VYGGLIASLIDCHCTGTAAAAHRAAGRDMDTEPPFRFVGLTARRLFATDAAGRATGNSRASHRTEGRKVVMEATLFAEGNSARAAKW
jgi:hypothetical protein